MNIIDKIAELSKVLGVYVHYEYSLRIGEPGELYCGMSEHYRVSANGYKTLYLPTFAQVLALTTQDFKKESE